MSKITVIGAGPLGQATINELITQGHDVVVATRHEISIHAAHWQMADIVTNEGVDSLPPCDAIIACHGIPYSITAWQRMWPAAADNLITAAQHRGARLVMTGNLYAYARNQMPMRATDPLVPSNPLGAVRAEVTRRLFDAHAQGKVEAVEVRGSDYIGADAPEAYLGKRFFTPLLAKKKITVIGAPDVVHTYTAVPDFGRLLARAATDPAMSGRAWHVPSAPAISTRDLARRTLNLAGIEHEPRFTSLPPIILKMLGFFSPTMRAVASMAHQMTDPYIMDDADTRELLGENHTELDETLRAISDSSWAMAAR